MEIKKRPKKKENLIIPNSLKRDYNPEIYEFASILKTLGDKINCDFFYYNMTSLKFTPRRKTSLNNSTACYDFHKNEIEYIKKYYQKSIMHELLHVASTIKTKKRIYSGFAQIDLESQEYIGAGLMEGYTCILDIRYFDNEKMEKRLNIKESYEYLIYIIDYLELFFGEDEMLKNYMNGDLYSLYIVLKELTSEAETLQFLRNLDNLLELYLSKKAAPSSFIREIREAYQYIVKLYLSVAFETYFRDDHPLSDLQAAIKYIENISAQSYSSKDVKQPLRVLTSKEYKKTVNEIYQIKKKIHLVK